MTHDVCYIQNELEKAEERLLKRLRTNQNKNQNFFEIECGLDSEGLILEMSSQSLQLLQFGPSEMIGMNLEIFIRDGDLPKWRNILIRILDRNSVIHTELSHKRKYDGIVVFRWSFFMDDDGVIHCKAKDEAGFLKSILEELILTKEINQIRCLL
ncbi:PAS domain-containing protein [Leptospira sp. 201903071]|uniref:PAS domain-containing protein n=1 Tax=Leptospira ainazelensis TaxID=2810034 RepID=UPI0019657E57|nr:PAS domain-containing protein [Leptospira ainazelensis]MBM9502085.1 PAS domain-containing protein [Leptospira ainazelensis]